MDIDKKWLFAFIKIKTKSVSCLWKWLIVLNHIFWSFFRFHFQIFFNFFPTFSCIFEVHFFEGVGRRKKSVHFFLCTSFIYFYYFILNNGKKVKMYEGNLVEFRGNLYCAAVVSIKEQLCYDFLWFPDYFFFFFASLKCGWSLSLYFYDLKYYLILWFSGIYLWFLFNLSLLFLNNLW